MTMERVVRSASKAKVVTRDAEASRARILEAARARFSNCSYEGVGVREIAADAGIDPALVMRYFGSKEGLFREIAAQAFGTDELLGQGVDGLAESAAEFLFGNLNAKDWRTGYDPLRFLLASIGSPTAGPILAEALLSDFIKPLQAAIGGSQKELKGAFVSAQIVGLALTRIVLASGGVANHEPLRVMFVDAVQAVAAPKKRRRAG